jgi:hypothetical protein
MAKPTTRRVEPMPSYTNPQLLFTIAWLGELTKKASEMLPGRSLKIAFKETKGPSTFHTLILRPSGMFYIKSVWKDDGESGDYTDQEPIRIEEKDQCEAVVEIFDLGPKDVTRALAKLTDPYQGSVQP